MSSTSVERLRQKLRLYNPWWVDDLWYEKDKEILEYERGPYRIVSRMYPYIRNTLRRNPNKYGIVTIRGPRRAGKTTVIKLLIRSLINELRIDPQSIYYISLDYQGLGNISLLEILETLAETEGDKYIFLDEVSMYENWSLDLKNISDLGLLYQGRLIIIATGSHSMDLAQAAEKLSSSRRGELATAFNLGGNLLFTPLRFSEVADGLSSDLYSYLSSGRKREAGTRFNILVNLKEGKISENLWELYNRFGASLEEMFEAYLIHGGYPKAVKEFHENKEITENFYYEIAELLINDSKKAGLDPQLLRKILTELVNPKKLSGPFNVSDLTEIERNLKEKQIRDQYLQYLKSTWAFFFSYSERKDTQCQPNYNENPKLYILDPFLFYSLYAYLNNIPDPLVKSRTLLEDEEFKGLLVESVVASHLLLAQQLFEHLPGTINYDRVLMYGKTPTSESKEIDFISCIRKKEQLYRFQIECKYRKHLNRKTISPYTIVLTRDILDSDPDRHISYVPVPLFLLLM